MAHTNATPNYSLPQFVGSDKPAWLTDVNGAMSAIDTAMKANEVSAATATASSAQNATAITAQATAISTLQTKVSALETAEPINEAQIATNTQNIATNAQNIVQIDNTLGHTSIAGIGDGKVTGAIADLQTQISGIPTSDIKVAWTNPTPSASFSGQGVSLNDSYDEVIVVWAYSCAIASKSGRAVLNYCAVSSDASVSSYTREVSLNSAGNAVTFGDSYVRSTTTPTSQVQNAMLQPTHILGIKFS